MAKGYNRIEAAAVLQKIHELKVKLLLDDVGILQAFVLSAICPCPKDKLQREAMVAYDHKSRWVSSGYFRPVRESDLCKHNCQMETTGWCYGIGAFSALNANISSKSLLFGGVVYSYGLPTCDEIKQLADSGVRHILFYPFDEPEPEVIDYVDNLRVPVNFSYQQYKPKGKILESLLLLIAESGLLESLRFEDIGLLLAIVSSKLSECKKQQAGCVAFSAQGELIGVGCNTSVDGDVHCKRKGCFEGETGVCKGMSSIRNMLGTLANMDLVGGTVFLTTLPDFESFKLLAENKIGQVVFFGQYPQILTVNDEVPNEMIPMNNLAKASGIKLCQYDWDGSFLKYS